MEKIFKCPNCGSLFDRENKFSIVICSNCGSILGGKNIASNKVIPIKEGDILVIEIEKISKNGKPYGKYKGCSVFVKETKIGDKVKVKICKTYPETSVGIGEVIEKIGTNSIKKMFSEYEEKARLINEANKKYAQNSVKFGGQNRKRCTSVLYPEERGKKEY
jgi:predicted RNA-binding protein with TRAM domain